MESSAEDAYERAKTSNSQVINAINHTANRYCYWYDKNVSFSGSFVFWYDSNSAWESIPSDLEIGEGIWGLPSMYKNPDAADIKAAFGCDDKQGAAFE